MKPIAKEHDLLVRVVHRDLQRVERRVDESHVGAAGLSVEQAAVGAGTRIMSPKQVKMTSGWRASQIASSTRPIGMTQHRAAGTVDQFHVLRQQVFDAVPVDRVGVPAAHLHELEVFV